MIDSTVTAYYNLTDSLTNTFKGLDRDSQWVKQRTDKAGLPNRADLKRSCAAVQITFCLVVLEMSDREVMRHTDYGLQAIDDVKEYFFPELAEEMEARLGESRERLREVLD